MNHRQTDDGVELYDPILKMRENRVVFYSINDGAIGDNLKRAEELLTKLDLTKEFSLNDAIEIYHVKLYFDNNLYLRSWDEQLKQKLIVILKQAFNLTKLFWIKFESWQLSNHLKEVNFNYRSTFWELTDNLGVYSKIEPEILYEVLNSNPNYIRHILPRKRVVDKFDMILAKFLKHHDQAAELLLSNFEQDHSGRDLNYFFPKSLSLSDREAIILRYIDTDEPNLNFVRLAVKCKDTDNLRLSEKVKLKAKRKERELNDKILINGHSWSEGVELSISDDQKEPVHFAREKHKLIVTYSREYLDSIIDKHELFTLFFSLFFFTDVTGRITLVNKTCEINEFEKIFVHSKYEYLIGSHFRQKDFLSYIQIVGFEHYLISRKETIFSLIESYISFLNSIYEVNLKFNIPRSDLTSVEKIRHMAPEFEFLLKQYKIYVEEGHIDQELLEFSSIPQHFSAIPTLNTKKYFYPSSHEEFNKLQAYFFSNQVMHYIEPYKDKYQSLFELLVNENVSLDQFEGYQIDILKTLIQDGYLHLSNDNHLKITQFTLTFIIGELYKNDVITYWHYPQFVRQAIDDMLLNGWICEKNTLFTVTEVSYLNYYLNKREYTNSRDIRNKYLHGSNPSSIKQQDHDYYAFLRIVILALLKIEDDLKIKKYLSN